MTVEVLVEGEGRKGNVKARTRTNKLVHMPGELPPGTFAHAEIAEAHPHHLVGTLGSVATPVGAGLSEAIHRPASVPA
jgi:tRNA A37 methylthiotransferase MiaB